MSWLSRVLGARRGGGGITLVKLRTLRFRQLVASYARMLELLDDAAEKQGGGFVFGRQYVVSVAEGSAELADAVAFDLNVLTEQRHLAFYDAAVRLRGQLREILAGMPEEGSGADRTPSARSPDDAPAVSPATLAAALARANVVVQETGQVASRGLAVGRVFRAAAAAELAGLDPGDVLVAPELDVDESMPATIRTAGAILLDRGNAAGPVARLARELRIPCIVGLADATTRLRGGDEVTVDADDGTIYLGRIQELLDYYAAARPVGEEEDEYQLLRTIRRAVFPLTFGADRSDLAVGDCRSLHDLVHLGHTLAGDALSELLAVSGDRLGSTTALEAVSPGKARIIDLEAPPHGQADSTSPSPELRCRPLRAFLGGLAEVVPGEHEHPAATRLGSLAAAVTEERGVWALQRPDGFDMIDATAVETDSVNFIYCRFHPRGEHDPAGERGVVAAETLERLDFAVARTGREVSALVRGLSLPETEERLRVLGRLALRLAADGDSRRHAAAVRGSGE